LLNDVEGAKKSIDGWNPWEFTKADLTRAERKQYGEIKAVNGVMANRIEGSKSLDSARARIKRFHLKIQTDRLAKEAQAKATLKRQKEADATALAKRSAADEARFKSESDLTLQAVRGRYSVKRKENRIDIAPAREGGSLSVNDARKAANYAAKQFKNGKPTVVIVGAMWCKHCKIVAEDMTAKGYNVIYVNQGEDSRFAHSFMNNTQFGKKIGTRIPITFLMEKGMQFKNVRKRVDDHKGGTEMVNVTEIHIADSKRRGRTVLATNVAMSNSKLPTDLAVVHDRIRDIEEGKSVEGGVRLRTGSPDDIKGKLKKGGIQVYKLRTNRKYDAYISKVPLSKLDTLESNLSELHGQKKVAWVYAKSSISAAKKEKLEKMFGKENVHYIAVDDVFNTSDVIVFFLPKGAKEGKGNIHLIMMNRGGRQFSGLKAVVKQL
jgi:thiol-disulfide isomerase/thioredoxin